MRASQIRQPSRIPSPGKGLAEISESQSNARSKPPSKMPLPASLKHKLGPSCKLWARIMLSLKLIYNGCSRRAGSQTKDTCRKSRRAQVHRSSHAELTACRERDFPRWCRSKYLHFFKSFSLSSTTSSQCIIPIWRSPGNAEGRPTMQTSKGYPDSQTSTPDKTPAFCLLFWLHSAALLGKTVGTRPCNTTTLGKAHEFW